MYGNLLCGYCNSRDLFLNECRASNRRWGVETAVPQNGEAGDFDSLVDDLWAVVWLGVNERAVIPLLMMYKVEYLSRWIWRVVWIDNSN